MPIEQSAPELSNIISTGEPILELADGFGGDQGPAEGPPQRVEIEGPGFHLVMSERAQQAPLGDFGAAKPSGRCRPLQRDAGAAQQTAHPPEIGLQCCRADVEFIGSLEHVDAVGVVQEGADERVEPVARCSGIRRRRGP